MQSLDNLQFQSILRLHSTSRQPLEFWHRMIPACPSLQVVYLEEDYEQLREGFRHISFFKILPSALA